MTAATATGVQYASGQDFFDSVLRHDYKEVVADTVITPNALLKGIKATDRRTSGQDVVFPIHKGRNKGFSGLAAYGILPDPGAQEYEQYAFAIRHLYMRCKFDGASRDASVGSASWLRAVDSEIKGAAVDLSRQRQRAMWNDGSGRLCQYVSGSTTTDIVVALHTGVPQRNSCQTNPTIHVKAGDVVAWVTPGTPDVFVSAGTVVSVDKATNTIVFDYSPTLSGSDCLVHCSSPSVSALKDCSYKNEPMGISGIIDDGNPLHDAHFQGVDASLAVNDWHRANLLANGGTLRSIDELLMDEAYQTSIEIADVEPTAIIGDFKIIRKVGDFLKDDRRFVAGTDSGNKTYGGGHKGLNWNGVQIEADRDAWGNRLVMCHKPDLTIDYMTKPSWMDMDGSVYHRMEDQDAYQATIFCRDTMSSDVRDKHTLLADIA